MELPAQAYSVAAMRAARRRKRRQRLRWRIGLLLALLALGSSLGTIWASGFATTTGATGTATKASAIFANPGNRQDTSGLNGLIALGGSLAWSWEGQFGKVASLSMYKVDLDTLSEGRYWTGVYLTNIPTGFSSLQLQMRIANVGKGGTCSATVIEKVANESNYRVFTFEASDAQVVFAGMGGAESGLLPGTTYCIGIANYTGSGQDTKGTFIRKSTKGSTFTGTYPTFIAALNRME